MIELRVDFCSSVCVFPKFSNAWGMVKPSVSGLGGEEPGSHWQLTTLTICKKAIQDHTAGPRGGICVHCLALESQLSLLALLPLG